MVKVRAVYLNGDFDEVRVQPREGPPSTEGGVEVLGGVLAP